MFENQPKKLERKVNITFTRENIKKNKRKNSTEKNGKDRVQNIEQRIKDVVKVEISSIQAKPKQQEHDEVANDVSNRQLQKNPIVRWWEKKQKAKEPKNGDRTVEVKRTQQWN